MGRVAAGSVVESVHRHSPHTVVSQHMDFGRRLVTYACECGETLPERHA